MNWIKQAIDLFLHLDVHLSGITRDYGAWTYLILFAVVFCETGLVITPFLPGDSLLFAVGALTANPETGLNIWWMLLLLTLGAILGDTVNYQIGHYLGPKVFSEGRRWLKREHLQRTHVFFEKYGGKTIIIARFVPIVRTFAPFVAGVGAMTYWKFLLYNVVGGIAWVAGFLFTGYLFGNMPLVKKNFSLVILAIIIISILPAIFEYWRARRHKPSTQENVP